MGDWAKPYGKGRGEDLQVNIQGPTTWGAIGSGTDHETDLIVGDGILRVTGPARDSLSIILR